MSRTYQNPFPFPIADPFVLYAPDGRYYLYGSSSDDAFRAHSSENLIDWRAEGEIYRAKPDGWCVDCLWAPECYHFDGRYYLFFSANWRENPNHEAENFRIGVAVSDHPAGPFTDLLDRPIFDPGYPIIDASVHFEDGRAFLYYSRCCYKHRVGEWEESWIYGVELEPDFSGVRGEPKLLLKPEQPWEGRSAKTTGRRWNEGSFLIRHEGRYYMTFSANFYAEVDYAVGYATADAPLGPFVKAAENPILEKGGGVTGPGHGCAIETPGGAWFFVYHGYTASSGVRTGFMDPIRWDGGRMRILGPTLGPQPVSRTIVAND